MLEEELFNNYYPNFENLLEYGFVLFDGYYSYEKMIESDSFLIQITVSKQGKVIGKVFDLELNDEYLNFRTQDSYGEFSGRIRSQFESLLLDIRKKCFLTQPFLSAQANRLCIFIKEKYGDDSSFEWESFPHFGVFKNLDTKKWYAIIMNIDGIKIGKEYGMMDVLNVKVPSSDIPTLLKKDGFYPAYHMNKKNWITIGLDDTVDDSFIYKLLEISYQFSLGHSHSNEWIIPVNPRYFDIDSAFRKQKIITWKQSSNVLVGDIVYLYVGSPISALRYKCRVLEVNIPYSFKNEFIRIQKVMRLELLKTYDASLYPFSVLKSFGITAIRGPRFMPKSFSDFIKAR